MTCSTLRVLRRGHLQAAAAGLDFFQLQKANSECLSTILHATQAQRRYWSLGLRMPARMRGIKRVLRPTLSTNT